MRIIKIYKRRLFTSKRSTGSAVRWTESLLCHWNMEIVDKCSSAPNEYVDSGRCSAEWSRCDACTYDVAAVDAELIRSTVFTRQALRAPAYT